MKKSRLFGALCALIFCCVFSIPAFPETVHRVAANLVIDYAAPINLTSDAQAASNTILFDSATTDTDWFYYGGAGDEGIYRAQLQPYIGGSGATYTFYHLWKYDTQADVLADNPSMHWYEGNPYPEIPGITTIYESNLGGVDGNGIFDIGSDIWRVAHDSAGSHLIKYSSLFNFIHDIQVSNVLMPFSVAGDAGWFTEGGSIWRVNASSGRLVEYASVNDILTDTQVSNNPLGYGESTMFRGYYSTIANTVVPVPTTVWLFSSGLIYLVGVARHKQAA